MPTTSTRTQMDHQRKDNIEPEGTLQWNCPKMSMMKKILTAQIRKEIYYLLASPGLLPEEQKGCRKGSRATAELLYIDQHILNKNKTRRKNVISWINYKKVYDIFLQSWIINNLKYTKYQMKS